MSFKSKFAAAIGREAPALLPLAAAPPADRGHGPALGERRLMTGTGLLVVTTMEDSEAVDLCLAVADVSRTDALALRRREFVSSMLDQRDRRGRLSESQWAWMHKIAAEQLALEIGGEEPGASDAQKGLAAIIGLFDASAASGLKRPRIVFAEGLRDMDVKFTRTSRGREPGSVCVDVGGEFAGRIGRDGGWSARGSHPGLDAFLAAFAADPWGFAAASGKKSGRCCFCARKLTDAKEKGSLEMGYGPICAAKYGKPHGK